MYLILNNIDKIYTVLILLFSSFLIRQSVILSGQNFIKTFSHTLTLTLLPIVTYTITSVITDNIALSLGMIGALSIVRFRNPVRSPFELVIYFAMISLGIAAAVSMQWLLMLLASLVFVLLSSQLLNKIFLLFSGKPLFIASFTEGNSLHTLEIITINELNELSRRDDLVSFVKNDDGSIVYRLASNDRKEMILLANMLEKNKKVKRITFNAA